VRRCEIGHRDLRGEYLLLPPSPFVCSTENLRRVVAEKATRLCCGVGGRRKDADTHLIARLTKAGVTTFKMMGKRLGPQVSLNCMVAQEQ
jgi:hypothetical protein